MEGCGRYTGRCDTKKRTRSRAAGVRIEDRARLLCCELSAEGGGSGAPARRQRRTPAASATPRGSHEGKQSKVTSKEKSRSKPSVQFKTTKTKKCRNSLLKSRQDHARLSEITSRPEKPKPSTRRPKDSVFVPCFALAHRCSGLAKRRRRKRLQARLGIKALGFLYSESYRGLAGGKEGKGKGKG